MSNELPYQWQQMTLEKSMEAIIDYRGKTPKKTSFGIPLITAKIVKDGTIHNIKEYIATKDYDSWMRRGIPKPGDVVMTTEAPLGEIAQLDNRKVALAQRLITLRGNSKILDNNYLKFLMQSSFVQDQLHARATGTTVLGIKQSELRKINLVIPPLPEQKSIARILSSLDDKIELNRQMNETLEAIGQTIFKSWFVDFDPVRAKMEGRQPAGMDAATADLFPNEFEESSLGLIPKGWKVKTVGDLVHIKHGYAFKGEFFRTESPGDILLTPGNFAIGGGFKEDKFKYYIGEVPEEFVLDEGDLLVSMTDLTKAGDTLGYPALIPPPRKGLYLHNQRLGKVIIKPNVPVSKFHLYYLLRTDEYRQEVLASATGTTVKHTSPDRIKKFKFPFPNNETSLRFGEVIAPLYEKFSANQEESRTLAAIRDTLLPKLMAGEIQVKDLENLAGNIRNPHHHF